MFLKMSLKKFSCSVKPRFGVQRLSDSLTNAGIKSEAIHGNKSQSQRQRALNAFKANNVRVLVANDVAARGLDIPNVQSCY